jgi:HAD superfamily hydrolase (TIGR01549 family)
MITLVILDYDDTILMTEEHCFHLENAIAADLGFAPMERELHKQTWGINIERAILDRFPGIDVEAFMSRYDGFKQKFISESKFDNITDDRLQVLDDLIQSGYKLAILTSRTYAEFSHLMEESHPLAKRMGYFHYKTPDAPIKPDPAVFNETLKFFNVDPSEAVYVGDALSDMIAAKNAGLHFICTLESGFRAKEDFDQNLVDAYINHLSEVKHAVEMIA